MAQRSILAPSSAGPAVPPWPTRDGPKAIPVETANEERPGTEAAIGEREPKEEENRGTDAAVGETMEDRGRVVETTTPTHDAKRGATGPHPGVDEPERDGIDGGRTGTESRIAGVDPGLRSVVDGSHRQRVGEPVGVAGERAVATS